MADRLAEIEERLDAASPGPWQWVNDETDVPEDPSRIEHGGEVSLRTVEEFPTRSVGPLPRFIIKAEEVRTVKVDGEWHTPDAPLIAHATTDLRDLLAVAKAARALMDLPEQSPHLGEREDALLATLANLEGGAARKTPAPTAVGRNRALGEGGDVSADAWMTPYQPLPGTVLGSHDSLEFGGDRAVMEREGLPLLDGVLWWHHADSPPAGARPKGGRCGGCNLHQHTLAAGTATADDLSAITVTPSLLCGACGRHIYVTGGKVRDLGNAHAEAEGDA